MDTTGSSSLAVEETYVSCICINGAPILPPILTDTKRKEMRYYRDLAIEREQMRRLSRISIPLGSNTGIRLDDPKPSTASSSEFSPPSHMNFTSTPRPLVPGEELEILNHDAENDFNDANKENISEFVKNRAVHLKDEDELPFSKSMSTSTSSNDRDQAVEDEVASLDDIPDDSDSEGNFASMGSSTGTFIIRTSLSRAGQVQSSDKSEGEVDEMDNDVCSGLDALNTVVRKSPSEPIFKRKRPVRYFETNDDYSSKSEQSTLVTSSTSLSKYLAVSAQTPISSSLSTNTLTPPPLPNTVQNGDVISSSEQSPSFTINTEFAATALALSKEKLPRRSLASRSRKPKYFSSPESSPGQNTNTSTGPVKTTDPNFDFVLSNEVPLSAQKLQTLKSNELDLEDSGLSDSSDKENCIEKKKHVRKLSYTLETPSAALIAASNSDGNVFTNTLAPIESAPNSVGIPSTANTPVKGQGGNGGNVPSTPSCMELDVQIDKVQVTLAKFQELSLGKGKKAHLERYLEEQNAADNGSAKRNLEITVKKHSTEIPLTNSQLDREKKVMILKEQFDRQVQKMLEEFENEQSKLIAESALEEFKQEQQQNNGVMGSTTPNQSSVLADTSNLRNYYVLNETPSKDGANSEIFAPVKSESNTYSSGYFQGHLIPGTPTSQPEQLSTVGLSKFQNKMQKMNPALFRNPADARSPLLKGLVFPDPLDRPKAPLRIPPEANDPAMKPKFDRLTALVKGYLIRRLLHSEKIQIIIQTVKDTVELLLNLYDESSAGDSGLQVEPQDEELHRRLLQQLTGTCSSFHDVFFKLSVKERMAIIANDREKIRAKALRNVLNRQNNSVSSPSKKNISTATLKSIERRLTLDRSPVKKDNNRTRKPVQSSSYGIPPGSRSAKPKVLKSYNLSPKRRRMSYWEDKPLKTNRTSSAVSTQSDKNKWTVPETYRSTNSARETSHNSGWSSDTFVIPSSRKGETSWQSQNSSSFKSNASRPSTGVSRFSVGNSNLPSSGRSVRNSSTRVPWKK